MENDLGCIYKELLPIERGLLESVLEWLSYFEKEFKPKDDISYEDAEESIKSIQQLLDKPPVYPEGVKNNERVKHAIFLLRQYALESGSIVRATTDVSPLESWLISRLYWLENTAKVDKQALSEIMHLAQAGISNGYQQGAGIMGYIDTYNQLARQAGLEEITYDEVIRIY